jgi:tRNA/rRNA methyltransferase
VLHGAESFNTLLEATADCDIRIAATARHRKRQLTYHDLRDLPELLATRQDLWRRVAIVFGREASGLSNEDLDACEIVSTIPQACIYPSLNLSQAVMVYSYTLAVGSTEVMIKDRRLDHREVLPEEYASFMNAFDILGRRFAISDGLRQAIKKRMAVLTLSDLHVLYRLKDELKAYLARDEQRE